MKINNIKAIISAFVFSITMSGCSWLNKPYLYGNESCGVGKTAYVYSNGKAAICLNEKSVAYIICARELGVISDETKNKTEGDISIPLAKTVEVGAKSENTVKVVYASEGDLVEARASAIETCVDIYSTYK
ncbi:MAG: hypothetical protein OQL19_17945 [Gammaproteobacteria bacterium]|nr:hypothetical protein [Gammaproteobacteria bacterium]